MKRFYTTRIQSLIFVITVIGVFCSCNNNDDTTASCQSRRLIFEGFVDSENNMRAHWSDLQGSGSFVFNWDYTADGREGNQMVMAFGKESIMASKGGRYYTDVDIKRHDTKDDINWVILETIEEYAFDLGSGDYDGMQVVALSPLCQENGSSVVTSSAELFEVDFPMPATFSQTESGNCDI